MNGRILPVGLEDCKSTNNDNGLLLAKNDKGKNPLDVANSHLIHLHVARTWTSSFPSVEFVEVKGTQMLEISLQTPLPSGYRIDNRASNNFLVLKNTNFGGIWRIVQVSPDKSRVRCAIPKGFKSAKTPENKFSWEVNQFYESDHEYLRTTIEEIKPVETTQESYGFLLKPLIMVCRTTLNSLDSIDTVQQSFAASFTCNLNLRGISFSSEAKEMVMEFMDILKIEDNLCFLRIKDESFDRYRVYKPSTVVQGAYDLNFTFVGKGTFSTQMELLEFPFDCQDLNITITCNLANIVHFVENREHGSIFMYRDFQLHSIFDVAFQEFVVPTSEVSDQAESSSGLQYPRISFMLRLSRKPEYYIYNVCLPIAFLSGLSLTSFGIESDGSHLQTSDRLSVTLTLLLTIVAYKFVIANSLPQVSYQTVIDHYVWCALMFMIVVILENIIYPIVLFKYDERHTLADKESYILVVLAGVFVAGNVAWFLKVFRLVHEKSRQSQEIVSKEILKRESASRQLKKSSQSKNVDETVECWD
jgi:hypothetical protein